ncbi:MAG: phosphotransferase family protein [Pseudomonadales bacterium]|nr:phosphotransferase family protein [Pseudomonadales bacterium]
MSEVLDQAGKVREGEELDPKIITDFVKSVVPDVQGEAVITQFPGGASNLTYSIKFDNKDYILRRPPFGTKAKSAHDMGREYKVMSKLKPVYPYVPEMVAFCEEEGSPLGCEFYIMERLVGIIPRDELPPGLDLTPEQVRKLSENVVDRFAELHNVDYEAAGLQDLGKGMGYVERQISGWCKRFAAAKTDDVPDFEQIMAWLNANMPEQVKVTLIHNDYRMDNVVLSPDDPTEVIGVLDWEMATLGDPLMDLGNSLAYWIQADDPADELAMRRQPTHLPGMLTREEVIARYLEKTGLQCDNFLFYHVYGVFRLAVILQQIYYRYYNGQTKDKRFAAFGPGVRTLEKQAMNLLKAAGQL